MKHYVVISADCHAGPNSPVYKDFLDPKYHDDFEVELAQRQALIDERREAVGMSPFMGDAEFKEEWFGEDDEGNSLHEIGMRGAWDAAKRDQELDNDGVTGEVMFPGPDAATGTMGAPFGAGFNPVATDGSRAPARRRACVQPVGGRDLPGEPRASRRPHRGPDPRRPRRRDRRDPARPRRRPAWRHHHPAAVGRARSYTSYSYDPVWAVAQELDLPVHCHSGPGAHQDYGEVPGWMSVYGYETIFFTARPMWFMLLTGVFERFPRLRMAITEAGSFWAADMLWRLDMMSMRDHGARKMADTHGILKMLPSEYFDRNCGIGSSNTRRRELARRYEIGVGNIMWGNDFPHPEGTWPYTREFLKDRFWDVPEDETAQILGLNAAEFYNFDLDKLAPIADRVGPTPEELGQTDASVVAKWDDLKKAGRPWLTDEEAVPLAVG